MKNKIIKALLILSVGFGFIAFLFLPLILGARAWQFLPISIIGGMWVLLFGIVNDIANERGIDEYEYGDGEER